MATESVEDVRRREQFVQNVEFDLAGSLNLRRTVQRLLTLVRPVLSDWAMLVLPDNRTGGLTVYGGTDVGFCDLISRSSATEPVLDPVLRTGHRAHVRIGAQTAGEVVAGVLRHPQLAAEVAELRPLDVLTRRHPPGSGDRLVDQRRAAGTRCRPPRLPN
jgi:phosphoserine phosphatase RsbU/P